jgi:hypothetical protein
LDKPEGDARRKENAYKSAVSEELDIMLLANICHAVERPSVNQRELYHIMKREHQSFFFNELPLPPAVGHGHRWTHT